MGCDPSASGRDDPARRRHHRRCDGGVSARDGRAHGHHGRADRLGSARRRRLGASRMPRWNAAAPESGVRRAAGRGRRLPELSFDRAFLGADAVTADRGICEAELEQTRLKELMMERAGEVYVLAHAAKLGRRPFHAWAPLPPDVTVVTDSSASVGADRTLRAGRYRRRDGVRRERCGALPTRICRRVLDSSTGRGVIHRV